MNLNNFFLFTSLGNREKEKGKKKEKDSDKQGNSKANEEVSKVIVKSEVVETVAQGFQKEKTEDVEKSNKIEKANLKNEANSKTTKGIVCILFFRNIMISKSMIRIIFYTFHVNEANI